MSHSSLSIAPSDLGVCQGIFTDQARVVADLVFCWSDGDDTWVAMDISDSSQVAKYNRTTGEWDEL